MRHSLVTIVALTLWLGSCAAADSSGELTYVAGSTRKVCQLTGDFDRTRGVPTLSRTGERFGVAATDLGSSFEHRGKLFFLFGDTWGRPGDRDGLAWTESRDPAQIRLDFPLDRDGKWLPPTVPGIDQGAFDVPSGGVSVGGKIYVVFTTDWQPETHLMGRSILAISEDDGRSFHALYELSRRQFINVSSGRRRTAGFTSSGAASIARAAPVWPASGLPNCLSAPACATFRALPGTGSRSGQRSKQTRPRFSAMTRLANSRSRTARPSSAMSCFTTRQPRTASPCARRNRPGGRGRMARSSSIPGATAATAIFCTSLPRPEAPRAMIFPMRDAKPNGAASTALTLWLDTRPAQRGSAAFSTRSPPGTRIKSSSCKPI